MQLAASATLDGYSELAAARKQGTFIGKIAYLLVKALGGCGWFSLGLRAHIGVTPKLNL